jgi:hypothetical protein
MNLEQFRMLRASYHGRADQRGMPFRGRVPSICFEVSGACDDAEAYGISLLTTRFPAANRPARGVLVKAGYHLLVFRSLTRSVGPGASACP